MLITLMDWKLQVKAEIKETCALGALRPSISSFQTGMVATLLNYVPGCVGAVIIPTVVVQCRLQ